MRIFQNSPLPNLGNFLDGFGDRLVFRESHRLQGFVDRGNLPEFPGGRRIRAFFQDLIWGQLPSGADDPSAGRGSGFGTPTFTSTELGQPS
jgi:hypothetical protein